MDTLSGLYETHSHTPLCNHSQGLPGEFAAVALERGLKGIIVTCHCPLPDGISSNVRMKPEEYGEYVAMVAEAREAWKDRLDVRLGLESDYYPGVESWLEELHSREPLNYVLGSIHYHVEEYRRRYFTGDVVAYQKLYYDHLAQAAESGLFDSLAHPDLVKNQDPSQWDFERIRPEVANALDRIAATGVAMELNTSGVNKALPEMNPGISQLQMMQERGIPVVIGADAHRPEAVGRIFEQALDVLESVGYRDVRVFLDRRPHTVSIESARASLIAPA